MERPLFTVFTATHNRAFSLPDTYKSLQEQTLRDFEWVIVDDGSSDGTADLVAEWSAEAGFPIRYFAQEHRGKPAAVNRGAREALGQLFLILDSDDTCVPDALERLAEIWESIPAAQRSGFSGVTVHCMDHEGRLVGTPFATSPLDEFPYRVRARVQGEKWGFHRTKVLRGYPYPEFPNETFSPDAIVWNRMGRSHMVRHVNVALRQYRPGIGGISDNVRTLRMRNPRGYALYYEEWMVLDIPFADRFKAAANYVRTSLHGGRSVQAIVTGAPQRALVAAAVPLGWGLALWDRHRAPDVKRGTV